MLYHVIDNKNRALVKNMIQVITNKNSQTNNKEAENK